MTGLEKMRVQQTITSVGFIGEVLLGELNAGGSVSTELRGKGLAHNQRASIEFDFEIASENILG